jgi:DNA polymerase
MRRLIGGDFSNVEGRINAWLAGEQWKLEAFEAFDNGTGEDLYKLAYARSFGVDPRSVGKGPKRQIGKVGELACGYQGGVGAYVTMGDTYNVKPWDLVKPTQEATLNEVWDKVQAKYHSATDKRGLPELQWTAVKIIVQRWREAHPKIVSSWWELGDAAVEAVSNPDVPVPVYNGRVVYLATGGWLLCRLPSGRVMHYCSPWIAQDDEELVKIPEGQQLVPHFTESGWIPVDRFFEHEIELLRAAGAEFWTRRKNTVRFMGIDPDTKQWGVKYLYGGLQCENIVQGTARCLMDHAMLRVEERGYPITLTVHDELLTEPGISRIPGFVGSVLEFENLMAVSPVWATGLPIAVSAWEDARYVK